MPTRVAEHESRNDSQSQTQACGDVRAKGKTFAIAFWLVASLDSTCSRSCFRRHISKTALHPKAAIVRGNILMVKIFAVCVFCSVLQHIRLYVTSLSQRPQTVKGVTKSFPESVTLLQKINKRGGK